ncbi:CRISPR-associated RAMP Csm5 family protein [Thermofilum pendens]|uniref:CRISPR-associated RAMP protein, Csm5 family n=1 Tax=Thermofilum pendens (strain DSM 2475 / Hrk 5) TaxID=368408 RepID=A1RZX9_THEPD|nr:CRISPR-associated RAMP Csm5 family protein [Thermofilum pendens]ABL78759.1 CRISPR-associated RAMP protein, Csm5 family [Thermofilum pendens Hrk 5]
MRRLTLKVEVVTPVHVWDGYERVYGLDVVAVDGQACVADFERLRPDALRGEPPAGLAEFAERVARWVREGALPCSRRVGMRAQPRVGDAVRLLPPTLVPASSLKGYLRTALLFRLLRRVAEERGSEEAAKLLRGTVNTRGDPRRAGEALENALLRVPRLRRQGGYADAMQSVVVSEPRASGCASSLSKLSVVEASGKAVGELVVEVLEGGSLEYEVLFPEPPPVNLASAGGLEGELKAIAGLLASPSPEELARALEEFGSALLEHEVERLRGARESLAKAGYDVATYLGRLEGLRGGGCAVARLGFATGHASKTLALLVKRLDPELYKEVADAMSRRLGRTWDELTFKLVDVGGAYLGAGWVKVCVQA